MLRLVFVFCVPEQPGPMLLARSPKRVRRTAPDGTFYREKGSLEWFSTMLNMNRELFITRVASQAWVLPDYDVLAGNIRMTPVQVGAKEE